MNEKDILPDAQNVCVVRCDLCGREGTGAEVDFAIGGAPAAYAWYATDLWEFCPICVRTRWSEIAAIVQNHDLVQYEEWRRKYRERA